MQDSLADGRRSNFGCSLFQKQIHTGYILDVDVWEIVGKLFCRWNGQVTGSKRAYRRHTSHSRSTSVLAFYLIGALSFHFTDCPHKRRALSSNSNHFFHYANDFPAEKLHAWCPSIQRGLQFEYMGFFLSSNPPLSHFSPPYFWKEGLFLMHSTGVHIAVVGE